MSGYVKDASNGETLIGSTVYVRELGIGTTTNVYGFYSLTLPADDYTVEFRFVGFETTVQNVSLKSNQRINVEIGEGDVKLQEVVVTGEAEDANVTSIEMSVNKVDIQTITELPSLLGENDVIRSIQLLPGITTVGEGASGFNVRGGGVGQNLILLDEAPVYNSSHLFGFFSVFNPDAVKDVKLYKGVMPARYGGRLSSILDVRMKEGNAKEFHGSGGIGFIFSRLNLEGPLIKDKASFIVAARRSYIDALIAPASEQLGLEDGFGLRFSDLTFKTNYLMNENNRIFLSGYLGRDVFNFDKEQGFSWGNQTATLRWNHLFSDKLFLNTSLIYSNYDYDLAFGEDADDQFDWESNVKTYNLKPQFEWFLDEKNEIRFGAEFNYYDFLPASAQAVSSGRVTPLEINRKFALESAFYLENEQKITPRLSINYGLRWSNFTRYGQDTTYQFTEVTPGERKEISGFRAHGKGDPIVNFNNFEPRILINYSLSKESSIKLGASRNSQYIHLVSNTTASNPLDVWTPSSPNIDPQAGYQLTGGYFRNFKANKYETSVELYYKTSKYELDYIDGADLLLNPFIEGDLLVGKTRAYGAEFYIKKNGGKLNGWASYTLGKSEQQTPNISQGQWYPRRFDQRHNIKIVGFYQINERYKASLTLTALSGTPTTNPDSRYYLQGYVFSDNAGNLRNEVRIPWYHRLDFSITKQLKEGKLFGGRYDRHLAFGAYNVYNRRNPFSIYFAQPTDENFAPGQPIPTQAKKVSIIGSIIPFISYNFKF